MCFKEYIKYSSLSVLGILGLSLYILADTYFVSRGIGADGLAALNIAIPVYSLINGIGMMLGMGGATRYSILKDSNRNAANVAFSHTIIFFVCFGAIFFITGITAAGSIASMLGASGEVLAMSTTYIKVMLLFAPLFLFNDIVICFVRNDGAPQLSMAAMIAGSMFNIVFDYIFIFPLNLGIFGAVLATGFAPVISLMILSAFFIRKMNRFHFRRCRLTKKMSCNIFMSGIASLITELSSGAVILVFNTIMLRLSGNIGVAAYGIIANISLVVIAVYTGIAQGIQPLVSQNYGVGNYKNADLLFKYAIITVVILSALIYDCVYIGAEQISGIFNNEHNAELQKIAVCGLKIYFTACVFAGFNIILSIYCTSTDRAVPANIISILRGLIIIIPMAFLLSAIWKINGLWLAFPITELLVSAIGVKILLK